MELKTKPSDSLQRRGLPLDACIKLEAELNSQRMGTRVLFAIGIAAAAVAIGCMVNSCNKKLSDETKSKAPMTETIRTPPEGFNRSPGIIFEI